jgi:hypothetical protein
LFITRSLLKVNDKGLRCPCLDDGARQVEPTSTAIEYGGVGSYNGVARLYQNDVRVGHDLGMPLFVYCPDQCGESAAVGDGSVQ